MSETDIQRRIQMEASRLGARLFRNQTGKYLLADGRWLSSGLAVGSSDLIGWITRPAGLFAPDAMVAQFVGCEVKTAMGRTSKEQAAFIECVARAGGIAGVCRSPEDLRALLNLER
jgi:VRR-NUC domain